MTQAELWHLQLLAVDNSIEASGILLTMISGYLAAAYFVGRRLSRFQVVLVSIFFLIGALLGSVIALVQFRRAIYFIEQLHDQFGVQSIQPNAVVLPLSGLLLLLLVPAALYFMYQIRRNPKLAASGDEKP